MTFFWTVNVTVSSDISQAKFFKVKTEKLLKIVYVARKIDWLNHIMRQGRYAGESLSFANKGGPQRNYESLVVTSLQHLIFLPLKIN